jgi:hypothetical protein
VRTFCDISLKARMHDEHSKDVMENTTNSTIEQQLKGFIASLRPMDEEIRKFWITASAGMGSRLIYLRSDPNGRIRERLASLVLPNCST